MTKVNTHSTHPPMFPITPTENAQPFETIAMDFITKLPLSGGYDTILMITDTDCSKASIFIPCNEAIDLEGVTLLYLNNIIPHYSIPYKIISDCDIHFISKLSTELCHILNIHQNISTAYHPQTDRASEQTNQTLEQYLRVFCGTQQNNWHAWLPLAQYTKNSWPSTTTKKTPFNLLISYTPQVHQPTRKTDIPSLKCYAPGYLCYNPPQFFSSLSDPLLITLSKPPPMAKRPLPLNPSPLPDLPPLPPSEPSKPLSPLDQPPVEPLVPIPWNIHCQEYSSMEMYQEPPPVEKPLEDPDSPMEDTLPLEPQPVTCY